MSGADGRATRAALYAGGFIGPFGGGVVTVLIPELRDAFDVSTATASLALTSYLVPFAALQLVSGTLGERLGRARATRTAFMVYALASLWAAVAGGFATFLIARAIQGAANAFTTPLVLAALADVTEDRDLGRTMGTFAAVQTAGVVGAPLVGGLAGAVDYRLAFVAAAVAAVGLAAMSAPSRTRESAEAGAGAPPYVRGQAPRAVDPVAPRTPPTAAPPVTDRGEAPRFVDAITPRTRWTAGAAFLAYFAITGLGVVVALRAGDAFGLGPTARGLLLAAFGAAGVVAGRPAGGLTDRRGAVPVALAGALACVVLLPLLGVMGGAAGLGLVWLAAGVASALLWAGLNVLTVGAATANRGGAVSLVGAFKFAGNALAPVVWLPIYAAGTELAFAGAGAVCVALGLAVTRAGAAAATRTKLEVESGARR